MRNRNRQWILRRRPTGTPGPDDLELAESPLPEPADGQVRVRTVYLSLDPAMRIWMSDIDSYIEPVELGAVMRGGAIGVVEDSRNDDFKPGDLVQGFWGWQDCAVLGPRELRGRIPADRDVPLTAYLGLLGAIGCTAWFGMLDIGRPRPGETVVVSAAAGAVGSIAGQLAKLEGARVIGIAGGPEKCRWVVDELGFDAAIDYRREDVLQALRRHCPEGIDVDFENVGGEIMDAVLACLNRHARVALCGLISTYNLPDPVPGPTMFRNLLVKSVLLKGFIVTDYLPRWPEALADLRRKLSEGRLTYRVDVVDGLEQAAGALNRLFEGANTGKLMVKVSEEP